MMLQKTSCASTVIDPSAFEQLLADGLELPSALACEPTVAPSSTFDGSECHDLTTGEPAVCALRSQNCGAGVAESSAISACDFHCAVDVLSTCVDEVCPSDAGIKLGHHPTGFA